MKILKLNEKILTVFDIPEETDFFDFIVLYIPEETVFNKGRQDAKETRKET